MIRNRILCWCFCFKKYFTLCQITYSCRYLLF